MINRVSFPNIGLEFTLDRVAFTVFGYKIYWYAIIITLGIILAVAYIIWRAKQENISTDTVMDYTIFTVVFAVIGARLYYVLTTLDQIDSFWDVFDIRGGGMAIYGSIIGGALTIFVISRIKRMNVLQMFDIVSPAVMIGQIVGRWGNFMNAEAYGSNTVYEFFGKSFNITGAEKLPWAMHIDKINEAGAVYSSVDCQPTFLYESLWNLFGFILINVFYKKKKYNGQIFFAYIAWYGLGRMFIEGMRSDSLYVGKIKISQLIALLCFVVGTVVLILGKRALKEKAFAGVAKTDEQESVSDTEPAIVTEPVSDESEKDEAVAEEAETTEKEEQDGEDN